MTNDDYLDKKEAYDQAVRQASDALDAELEEHLPIRAYHLVWALIDAYVVAMAHGTRNR